MDSKALLHQIIHTARKLQQETRCLSEQHSGPSAAALSDPELHPLVLDVPSPYSLVHDLVEVGAPKEAAGLMSKTYHASAKRLAEYQSNTAYMGALRKLHFSLVHADFVSAFQEAHRQAYQRYILKWKQDILHSVKERSNQTHDASEQEHKSKPFNQKSVPLLEKCFSKNQRPSREDKELLARKTGMSYRQIHVWFQNRRSRMQKSLDTPVVQDEEQVCSSRNALVTLAGDNPLSNSATPSYAYPVRYPPEVLEDPFPCRCGDFSSFSKPCWPRIPSTTRCKSQDIDISGLVAAFGKLRMSDAVKKDGAKRKPPSTSKQDSECKLRSEATWPLIIRPLRVPLAALIRTGSTCLQRLSCTSAPEPGKQDASTNGSEENRPPRTRKARQCASGKQRRTAVSMKQQQAHQTRAGPSSSATFSDPSPPSRVKKTEKRAPRARRSTRRARKADNGPDVEIVEAETSKQSPEPLTSQSSPTPSVESLPSLSYSSGSSSSSTYSQSPPSSFSTLSDDGHSPPHDAYQSTDYSLTLPTSQTGYDEYPTSTSAFDGFSFDLAKGPLDHSLNFGLPEYPSYSDTFDSLSQELQSSSDFAPLLSFESPPLAS